MTSIRISRIAACAMAATFSHAAASSFVYESATGFHAGGDFNGDGHRDVLVIDRSTGLARIALGAPAGDTWTQPLSGGIPGASAVAVGRLLESGRDAWAATSPVANRIQVLGFTGAHTTAPLLITPANMGFDGLAALPVGGLGADDTLDDLALASSMNAPNPHYLELLRNGSGSGFTTHSGFTPVPVHFRVISPNPLFVTRQPADRPMLMHLVETGGVNRVQIHNVAGGVANPASPTGEWIPSAHHTALASGFFGAAKFPHVIAYSPGEGAFASRAVKEGDSGYNFTVDPPHEDAFISPIRSLTVISRPAPVSDRLLVVFDGKENGPQIAVLYDYDGINLPVEVVSFQAPTGATTFLGAVPDGAGGFMTLGGNDYGSLVASQRHDADGNIIAGSHRSLPLLNPLGASANVLFYDQDPEISSGANLLGTRAVGDWTSELAITPGNVSVLSETFGDTVSGLAGSSPSSLGSPPPGTGGGRANQPDLGHPVDVFNGAISYYTFVPALGRVTPVPLIDPIPGDYQKSIRLEFTASPGAVVRYRLSDPAGPAAGPWYFYEPDTSPIWLTGDTRVDYFAERGNIRSDLLTAIYQVGPPGGDSNDDGLPDKVRLALGLDPTGDADSDGDGVPDIIELLYGTDPHDSSRLPYAEGYPEFQLAAEWGMFSLAVRLAAVDGRAEPPGFTWALEDTAIIVEGTNGDLLGVAPVVGEADLASALVARLGASSGRPHIAVRSDAAFSVWAKEITEVKVSNKGSGYSPAVKATVPGAPGTVLDVALQGTTIEAVNVIKSGTFTGATPPVILSEATLNQAHLIPLAAHGKFGREMLGLADDPEPYTPPLPSPPAGVSLAAAQAWIAAARAQLGITLNAINSIALDGEQVVIKTNAAHGLAAGDFVVLTGVSGSVQGAATLLNNGFMVDAIDSSSMFRIRNSVNEFGIGGHIIHVKPSAEPAVSTYTLTYATTLAALAYERVLGDILEIDQPTLFPQRPSDVARVPIGSEEIFAMRRPAGAAAPAYSARELRGQIEAALLADPPVPALVPLRNAALAIYQVSSARDSEFQDEPDLEAYAADPDNYVFPPKFMEPIDAIRELLATGVLPTAYANALMPKPAEMTALAAAVAHLRAMPTPRPFHSIAMESIPGGITPTCTVLKELGGSQLYALVDDDGDPWQLQTNFLALEGMSFLVHGYLDAKPAPCANTLAIEVVSVSIIQYPRSYGSDNSGSLFADAWEKIFGSGVDPMDWTEINGQFFRRLQIFLEGSDPLTGTGVAAIGPIDVGPPQVQISPYGPDAFALWFQYPERYAPMMRFPLLDSMDLNGFHPVNGIEALLGDPAHPGDFHNIVPRGEDEPRRFFRYDMRLK
jgi:hypothetical protein